MGIGAKMIVRGVPEIAVSDEWLKEMSWRLCQAIGAERFHVEAPARLAIDRSGALYPKDGLPGRVYVQDGDDIVAVAGECLLQLSLWGRYYGAGYERGDILAYCAIAEWLEANIEGGEVWYGGDSSGVCAKPFGEVERKQLKEHLFSKNGRDYFSRFGAVLGGDGCTPPPACGLCPRGIYRGQSYGFGRNGMFGAFSCEGCGKSVITEDGGKTWQPPKEW